MRRILVAMMASTLVAQPAMAQSSESAINQVIAALTDMRQLVVSNTPGGDGTARAQGMRYALRQIEQWLATDTEDADPAHPTIQWCPGKSCKLGLDNPDNTFFAIGPIDDQRTYRITGHRGNADLITFQIFEGGLGGTVAVTSDDLVFNPDGTYEVLMSPTPQPGNWLQTLPASQRLIARVYHLDPETERQPSMQVEVVGEAGSSVPHLTPGRLQDGLTQMGQIRLGFTQTIFQNLRNLVWPLNDVLTPAVGSFGLPGAGFPGNWTSTSRYDIQPGEALVVEVDNTPSRYQNIQLANIWTESLDYASRQVALNRTQAYEDPDGKFRYVLAHTDPGVPNWLDVSGHDEGVIFMRFLIPDPENLPTAPNVQLIQLADLATVLPAGHPTVSPAERAETLRKLRLAYNRRTAPSGLEFELVSDADGDGEIDGTDQCSETSLGAVVDAAGCSQDQFCGAVETNSIPGLLGCLGSDFGNDEPGVLYPSDCQLRFQNPVFTCTAG